MRKILLPTILTLAVSASTAIAACQNLAINSRIKADTVDKMLIEYNQPILARHMPHQYGCTTSVWYNWHWKNQLNDSRYERVWYMSFYRSDNDARNQRNPHLWTEIYNAKRSDNMLQKRLNEQWQEMVSVLKRNRILKNSFSTNPAVAVQTVSSTLGHMRVLTLRAPVSAGEIRNGAWFGAAREIELSIFQVTVPRQNTLATNGGLYIFGESALMPVTPPTRGKSWRFSRDVLNGFKHFSTQKSQS